MKKRRLISILMALAMLTAAIPAAGEENYVDIKARDLVLSREMDVLGCRFENSNYYCLIHPDGTKITDEIYSYIYTISGYPYFRVEVNSEDGIHNRGIIDAQGNTIVPAKYANVTMASERWAYGITLVPSNADDKDYTYTNYSTNEKNFYRINTVDFYFRGQMVGTLSRSDFEDYVTAYGDYICVTTRDKVRKYYNSSMEAAPEVPDSSGEYTSTYKKGKSHYTHNGSGQRAFEEGCTLTPEEVDKSIIYENGKFLNLQGGEAFKAQQNYDSVRQFKDGYAVVTMNRMRGVIDATGREVIPVEYDDIGNSEDHPFEFGCISAVKDGKFGFLDAEGNVTCNFVYTNDIVRNYGVLATIKNLDGTTIVLSGQAGELPEHYADVDMIYNAKAFVAKDANDDCSLIGLNGETLIPYVEVYSIEVNRAATVAYYSMGNRTYRIYSFGQNEQAAAVEAEKPREWKCPECGKEGNTGNFCGNCGHAAP